MSIEDDLDGAREDVQRAKEPQRRVEWNGDNGVGVIETGRVSDGFNPKNLDDVLRHHGLDPECWRIIGHCGFTEWDVPHKDPETGERNFHKAQSHRFNFEQKTWAVDLPALYAEVAKTKAKPPKAATGDATVVVCWADVQTGKVDYLGGLKELLERLDEKRDNLERYFKHHRKQHGFDHIIIADAGDIIEGFQNFDAQTRTNALSIMDQVDVAATELWKTIRLCAQYAPVDVLSIPSNHCRWAKGKSLVGKTTDDWGLHVNKRLERHNEEIGLPVTFHRTEEWMETLQFDVRNSKIGLAHGHQANNPDQIKAWWAKMTHAGVLDCDILVTGHFHFPSLRPSGKRADGKSKWHVQASTLDNGSAWVRNKYGDDGDPALTVFQINDDGFDVQSFALL